MEGLAPHPPCDLCPIGNGASRLERLVEGRGVEDDGVVECRDEGIHWLLPKGEVELLDGRALDVRVEGNVLGGVGRGSDCEDEKSLVRPLRPLVVLDRVILVLPRPVVLVRTEREVEELSSPVQRGQWNGRLHFRSTLSPLSLSQVLLQPGSGSQIYIHAQILHKYTDFLFDLKTRDNFHSTEN